MIILYDNTQIVQVQGIQGTGNGNGTMELGQGGQNGIEASFLIGGITNFPRDIVVTSIFTRLFGKSSECYNGATTISNLRDLLAFGLSNKHFFDIVFGDNDPESGKSVGGSLVDLVSYYMNDTAKYHKDCFKVCDAEDGIKILMLKGCEANFRFRYLIELNSIFQNKITEYLMSANLYDRAAKVAIENTIKTLSIVIKTKEGNELVNGILISICNVLLDETTEQWQKRVRALDILVGLVHHRCLAAENKKFVEIAKGVESLLGHNAWQVVGNAILTIV